MFCCRGKQAQDVMLAMWNPAPLKWPGAPCKATCPSARPTPMQLGCHRPRRRPDRMGVIEGVDRHDSILLESTDNPSHDWVRSPKPSHSS